MGVGEGDTGTCVGQRGGTVRLRGHRKQLAASCCVPAVRICHPAHPRPITGMAPRERAPSTPSTPLGPRSGGEMRSGPLPSSGGLDTLSMAGPPLPAPGRAPSQGKLVPVGVWAAPSPRGAELGGPGGVTGLGLTLGFAAAPAIALELSAKEGVRRVSPELGGGRLGSTSPSTGHTGVGGGANSRAPPAEGAAPAHHPGVGAGTGEAGAGDRGDRLTPPPSPSTGSVSRGVSRSRGGSLRLAAARCPRRAALLRPGPAPPPRRTHRGAGGGCSFPAEVAQRAPARPPRVPGPRVLAVQVHSEAPAVAVGLAGALGAREPLAWRAGTVLQCDGLAGDRAPICSSNNTDPPCQPSDPFPMEHPPPRAAAGARGAGHAACPLLRDPPSKPQPVGTPTLSPPPHGMGTGRHFGAGRPFPPHHGCASSWGLPTRGITLPGCGCTLRTRVYPHGCALHTRV